MLNWINTATILPIILSVTLTGLLIVVVLPPKYKIFAQEISLIISILLTYLTIGLIYMFDQSSTNYQFSTQIPLGLNFQFLLGLDGISLPFLLLTTFIMPLCFYAATNIQNKNRLFIICLSLLQVFLIGSFIITDVIYFYIFFESALIPMFIMIGVWGSRARRIKAAYYFFLYTLFGSLFMLFGIIYIYIYTGTTSFDIIINTKFTQTQQIYLWICFFLPFAIKVPMLPFHIWLPEAHVEAPTLGSIILASLLLKLGGYGMIRFIIPMFSIGTEYFLPLVYTLGLLSIIYASLSTIRQIDLKRIIAYSSVAHMNMIVLGIFSQTQNGLDGALHLMLAHGIVSSALFYCVGVLYDRYHTRLIIYYGGLTQVMPITATYFFLFTLANMAFPGTSNYIGEFLILVGLYHQNTLTLVLASLSILLSAIYSIWLFNRIFFGTLKINFIKNYNDLRANENNILSLLLVYMLILGINSNIVLYITANTVAYILIK